MNETRTNEGSPDLMHMTAEVVSAYVRNNPLPPSELAPVINAVHSTFMQLRDGTQPQPQRPVVPIKKSVTPDYLICLEDGKKLKMLKRHLRTAYNMTPEEYRAKWGLPPDYPMVAPSYAKERSQFAKDIGLGRATRKGRAAKGSRKR